MVAIQNGGASGVGNPSPDRLEVFGVNEGGVRWRMAWAVDELWVDGGVLVGAGPEAVRALERQRVRIRGYILPSFQQRGITQFVLVRDNMECCFGPGALLHDCVVVRMLPGRSTDFSIRPVAVSGTFRVDELKGPDGKHLAVYAIDGEEVR